MRSAAISASVGRDVSQEIHADGELEVARVEIDQVIGPSGRNVVEKFVRQIAVGINQSHAVPGGEMLNQQVA